MVLVFADHNGGAFKKAAFEVVSYGKKVAEMLSCDCSAVVLGTSDSAGTLGQYGASKVINVTHSALNSFDSQAYTSAIAQVAEKVEAKVIIVAHNSSGKSITGRLSARLDAAVIGGAKAVPSAANGFVVEKNVFSGKGIAAYQLNTDVKIISLMGNSIQPEVSGADVSPEIMEIDLEEPKVKVIERKTVSGIVPLPEAELVVSAGRGVGAVSYTHLTLPTICSV